MWYACKHPRIMVVIAVIGILGYYLNKKYWGERKY